jgi:fructokinase
MWRIGVDLGGTKIEALALSPEGEERNRLRVPTPRGDYEGTLDAIAMLAERCQAGLPADSIAGIGVGIPGSLSPKTGLVRNANSTWLNGKPFLRDLQAKLSWPVAVENDANCFTLSEAADGAAHGYRAVFGVILGTGVGGGLVIDGRLLAGRNFVGGEWGHNPLPWPDDEESGGPPCYCGKRGCIETFLCGPALERQYRELTNDHVDAETIAKRAGSADPAAEAVLSAYARRLAKSLATVINIADPDVIVFGGGLSNIGVLFEKAQTELGGWVFSDYCESAFKLNKWGDSSGVRGAARLIAG